MLHTQKARKKKKTAPVRFIKSERIARDVEKRVREGEICAARGWLRRAEERYIYTHIQHILT